VGDRLSVRGRTAGDRFEPAGMAGRKKVQDFMVDAKIPREWRDRVPMVVSERGIAWIVGWRVAEWAKATPEDGAVLEIRFALDGD
jgi:tRNA(Ile)-lysidine synthase